MQLASGLLAAWVVRIVVEPVQLATATTTLAGRNVVAAFVVELLFTFSLCDVAGPRAMAFEVDNGTTEAASSRRHHPGRVASPLPGTRNHLVGEGIRHAHVSSPPMAPVTSHASTKADSVA